MTSSAAQLFSTHLAAAIPLFIAIAGIVWARRPPRSAESSALILCATLASASLSVLIDGDARWALLGVALICATRLPKADDTSNDAINPLSVAGFVIASFLAVRHLGTYSSSPVFWEGASLNWFFDEIANTTLINSLLQRMSWSNAPLGDSNASLVYGFPTLVLLSISSSMTALRLMSAIYFLGSVGLIYAIAKRFVSNTAAAVVVFVFGLNELALFFGRYGCSISAMTICGLAALWCCARIVAQPSIGASLLCAITLYLTTLTYAPGRYIATLLATCTVLGLCGNESQSRAQKIRVLSWFAAFLTIPCLYQTSLGNLGTLTKVRQEHLFGMFESGEWPESVQPEWRTFIEQGRTPTVEDYVHFARVLITKETAPQLATLLSPYKIVRYQIHRYDMDPLFHPLYAPALFPFLLVGVASIARGEKRWLHYTLLTWVISVSALLLVTSRVDAYRGTALLIPITLWISAGIAQTIEELRRISFPRAAITSLVFFGIALGVHSAYLFTSDDGKPPLPEGAIIDTLPIDIVDGSIIGVAPGNFRTFGFMKLMINSRRQLGEAAPSRALLPDEYNSLRNPQTKEGAAAIEALAKEISSSRQLVLGPSNDFEPAIQLFAAQGLRTSSFTTPGMTVTIISK